jgi:hypothetical protein
MLTDNLARVLDVVLEELEITPEMQELWADLNNRDALYPIIRRLSTEAHKLETPDGPKRGYLPKPTITTPAVRKRYRRQR